MRKRIQVKLILIGVLHAGVMRLVAMTQAPNNIRLRFFFSITRIFFTAYNGKEDHTMYINVDMIPWAIMVLGAYGWLSFLGPRK